MRPFIVALIMAADANAMERLGVSFDSRAVVATEGDRQYVIDVENEVVRLGNAKRPFNDPDEREIVLRYLADDRVILEGILGEPVSSFVMTRDRMEIKCRGGRVVIMTPDGRVGDRAMNDLEQAAFYGLPDRWWWYGRVTITWWKAQERVARVLPRAMVRGT